MTTNTNNKSSVSAAEKWAERIANHDLNSKGLGKKFAFYGSLRKEQYNYNSLLKNSRSLEFEGTKVLPGYKMYSMGSFPFVTPSGNESDTIIVELFTVPDEMAAYRIHAMETGAGYAVEEITIDDQTYWLYVYNREGVDYEKANFERVVDGDWVTFIKVRGSGPYMW